MKRRNQAAIEHNVKYMRWLTDKEAVVMYTVIRCHIQRIKFKFEYENPDQEVIHKRIIKKRL